MKKPICYFALSLIFTLSMYSAAKPQEDKVPTAKEEEKQGLKSQQEAYKKIRGCFDHYQNIIKPKINDDEQVLRKELSKLKARAEKLSRTSKSYKKIARRYAQVVNEIKGLQLIEQSFSRYREYMILVSKQEHKKAQQILLKKIEFDTEYRKLLKKPMMNFMGRSLAAKK